jgi:hypothetical protein
MLLLKFFDDGRIATPYLLQVCITPSAKHYRRSQFTR